MILDNLFEIQRKLDTEIGKKHPRIPDEDRLEKRVLALLVELGECANEWRGFKFWSVNQNPNLEEKLICDECNGEGDYLYWNFEPGVNKVVQCSVCDGKGYFIVTPLLEEYVDCLHFALSIGLEHRIPLNLEWESYKKSTIAEQFIDLLQSDWSTYYTNVYHGYCRNMELLIGLGEMLGFTWDEVEKAYLKKNQVNHQRQANGY